MEAQLILADAASVHPDGTFSLLRGGITHLWSEAKLWTFRGSLLVRIFADIGDRGQHKFDLAGLDEDGKQGGPSIQGQFDVAAGGVWTSFVLGIDLKFKKPGKHIFFLRVDNVQRGELTITVAKKSPANPQGGTDAH